MRYIQAIFGAISACTLAWGGFVLCVWTLVQAWLQIQDPTGWQLLNLASAQAVFQAGMVANLVGITMLLSLSSYRWFRGRWEHYVLTAFALVLILLDSIGVAVIKFALT